MGNSRRRCIAGAIAALSMANAVMASSDLDRVTWIGAAQDSTGLVWGIADTGEMLFTNRGLGWEKADSSWAGGKLVGMPEAITRTTDGAVAILWNTDWLGEKNEKHVLTEHRGKDARILVEFSAILDRPSLFGDGRGNLWITERLGGIYRFHSGQSVEKVYTIGAAQRQDGKDHEYVMYDYLDRIFPIEDKDGANWFWTDSRDWNVMSLATLLVCRDGKFTCPVAEGLPPMGECTCAVREDPSHILATFGKKGIYRLDLHTLRAEPILLCDEKRFHVIRDVVPVGGEIYVSAWGPVAGPALWRLAPKAEPVKLTELTNYSKTPMPCLVTKNGILIGTTSDGLLWIEPNKSKVERYDKLHGFGIGKVTQLFALGAKGILAVSEERGSTMTSPPPWSSPPPHAAFQIADISEAPTKDARGRFWARSRRNGESIMKWDGRSWTVYPLPKHNELVGLLSFDNQGRIWLHNEETVFIFDPRNLRWRIESGMHAALEHALAGDRHFNLSENGAWHGAFAGDGRVCYREDTGVFLEYYDGRNWRVWKDKSVCYLLPSFDHAGQLTGVSNDQRWSFDGNAWKKGGEQPSPTPATALHPDVSKMMPLKVDGITSYYNYDQMKHDEMGNVWMTENHRLYCFRRGLLAPVFSETEPDPFCDGRTIRRIVNDGDGNAFFDTSVYGECLLFRFGKPPRTKIHGGVKGDSLVVKLSAEGSGARWFEWRLDQSNWSGSTEKRDFAFSLLPNGKHVFEARGITARFQVDPAGAKYEFRVSVDRQKQVAEALRSLRAADFSERGKAVRILASQPAIAREQLQNLRQSASPDEAWWIDAAIQEMDRASKRPSPLPSP